ncbi:shikimate kinase [Orenia marismortui]|uniref:Shikimate kinase n=1 Tax=Orenia marismortui TaxID=46469 RepID=A0A4R8GIB5_9FIRM|nr:shikimate kinase [Orenia marismortui]TDX45410.1 shikimate kinase [Orenia marismortui]
MNISLIGFMGTGKSTIGHKLAERLNYKFIDLDEEIVKIDGRPIPTIFAENGEKYFRDLESKATAEISKDNNQVIATGGGIVLRPKNIEYLKSKGIVVLLEASAEVIFERTQHDNNRPLLEVADPLAKIKTMMEERADKYNCTEHQIDTTALSVEEVIEEIIKIMDNE